MDSRTQVGQTELPPGKQLLYSAITLLISLLLIELLLRVYFAFTVGPSVMLYGTSLQRKQVEAEHLPSWKYLEETLPREERLERTVGGHGNDFGGYTKYFPNQRRVDIDVETQERFEVGINNRGFRGEDFAIEKAPGVIRVLTLGASSTFGFFDRDDETYPVYLEQLLNDSAAGNERYEVINLGIPHLTARNIYQLFVAEGLELEPDVVTFYEGNNDASNIKPLFPRSFETRLRHAINKAGKVSVAFGLLDSLVDSNFEARYAPDKVKEYSGRIADGFVENLDRIRRECDRHGIIFIVASQQKNSEPANRAVLKGLTFQEEVDRTWEKLLRPEEMSSAEIEFLAHSIIMQRLRAWVQENRVAYVDMIEVLDNDRDVMLSTVHLSARGNQMVAKAFAGKIRELLEAPLADARTAQ